MKNDANWDDYVTTAKTVPPRKSTVLEQKISLVCMNKNEIVKKLKAIHLAKVEKANGACVSVDYWLADYLKAESVELSRDAYENHARGQDYRPIYTEEGGRIMEEADKIDRLIKDNIGPQYNKYDQATGPFYDAYAHLKAGPNTLGTPPLSGRFVWLTIAAIVAALAFN